MVGPIAGPAAHSEAEPIARTHTSGKVRGAEWPEWIFPHGYGAVEGVLWAAWHLWVWRGTGSYDP